MIRGNAFPTSPPSLLAKTPRASVTRMLSRDAAIAIAEWTSVHPAESAGLAAVARAEHITRLLALDLQQKRT